MIIIHTIILTSAADLKLARIHRIVRAPQHIICTLACTHRYRTHPLPLPPPRARSSSTLSARSRAATSRRYPPLTPLPHMHAPHAPYPHSGRRAQHNSCLTPPLLPSPLPFSSSLVSRTLIPPSEFKGRKHKPHWIRIQELPPPPCPPKPLPRLCRGSQSSAECRSGSETTNDQLSQHKI
jgi:hypothetical protein